MITAIKRKLNQAIIQAKLIETVELNKKYKIVLNDAEVTIVFRLENFISVFDILINDHLYLTNVRYNDDFYAVMNKLKIKAVENSLKLSDEKEALACKIWGEL